MALAQELEQQQGALDQQRSGEMAAISQLEGQQAEVAGEKQKATAAPLAAATSAAQDLSKTADQPLPPSEAASIGYTPHKADAKQIEGLSWALLGMALIGGAASKGNWLGVSSSLNGAMRGFISGDQLKAQKEWEDFQTKFETAERHDRQALDRLKTVRDNKNLSLNAKMQQYQLIAAEFDMQDAKLAAQVKSHDAVLKSIDSRENSITQARSRLEAVQERMALQKAAANAPVEDTSVGMILSGMPLNQAIPGYGNAAVEQRKQALKKAGDELVKEGMTRFQAGHELALRQVMYKADASSVMQLNKMLGATKAAVPQLEYNIKKAEEEMKKLPSSDISPVINAIARGEEKWTGAPAYSSLFFYMEGVATESARILSGGQASIAQLHEGARQEAEKWANINMTPQSFIEGVAPAMLGEGQNRIQNFQEAIQSQSGAVAGPSGGKTLHWDEIP